MSVADMPQMGLSWLVILEACKYIGRKHRRLIYIRAIGPLLVRVFSCCRPHPNQSASRASDRQHERCRSSSADQTAFISTFPVSAAPS